MPLTPPPLNSKMCIICRVPEYLTHPVITVKLYPLFRMQFWKRLWEERERETGSPSNFPPVEPSPPFATALFVIVSLVRRQLWDHYVGRRTDDDALWKLMISRRRVATRKRASLVSSDRAERRRISFSIESANPTSVPPTLSIYLVCIH